MSHENLVAVAGVVVVLVSLEVMVGLEVVVVVKTARDILQLWSAFAVAASHKLVTVFG